MRGVFVQCFWVVARGLRSACIGCGFRRVRIGFWPETADADAVACGFLRLLRHRILATTIEEGV